MWTLVNFQGVKTVERKECKTVLENVCSVKFVTECNEKPSTNPIDSYGAPKAPLLRRKRQVPNLEFMGEGISKANAANGTNIVGAGGQL